MIEAKQLVNKSDITEGSTQVIMRLVDNKYRFYILRYNAMIPILESEDPMCKELDDQPIIFGLDISDDICIEAFSPVNTKVIYKFK